MNFDEIIQRLESLKDEKNIEGMARFGITPSHTYGIRMPVLRTLGKEIGKNHSLALALWKKDNRETRILATLVDEVDKVTKEQMERWTLDFDYWEICDQACINLFYALAFAYEKAIGWSARPEEYVKRCAFVLMARFAVSFREKDDSFFEPFFVLIKRESTDERAMVKKAVNWALRQIGKRNKTMNRNAISVAEEILKIDSKSARWIAKDALKELRSDAVQKRLAKNK